MYRLLIKTHNKTKQIQFAEIAHKSEKFKLARVNAVAKFIETRKSKFWCVPPEKNASKRPEVKEKIKQKQLTYPNKGICANCNQQFLNVKTHQWRCFG